MSVTSPPIGFMDITVIFGAIGGYIASMRLMDKNPLALRNKLKEIFWTVSRFQEVISIGKNEFVILTLADFENVPSRYKKGRHLIALYNLVFLRFYWLVSIFLLTCTGLKIYLEIAKEDFPVQSYNEYNIYLMSSFGLIILSILLLCGIYSIFVGFESAKQKIDAKGDYVSY